MRNIIVFGAGGQAKAVIDVVEKAGQYRIIGLLDDYKAPGTRVYGYEVLGPADALKTIAEDVHGGIVAIGDNWLRYKAVAALLEVRPEFRFVSAIHPRASVAKGAVVGAGTVVMAGAVVNSDTVLGEHCVLYTNSSVDHDSLIGDFVSFAPNAATGGGVRIGSFCAIAMGANVVHAIRIGEHAVIGAGSTVLSDMDSYVVAYGVPARPVRKRAQGEGYL